MINHRNKQNYRLRTWNFRDRCHLKGGVRQGCFLSLILNCLIQYIHFHSLYITSHYYAKFKENPCVGTDARPPLSFAAVGFLLIIEILIIILPTKNDWASSCRHVEEVERKYWDADIAVEVEMEKIVIQVTSSDEDTDTATECSDYSDTESADEECLC